MVNLTSFATIFSVFYNVIITLLLLMLAGKLLARIHPSLPFRRPELALICAMLTIGSAMGCGLFIHQLMLMLPYEFQTATTSDPMVALIRQVLPEGLVVTNANAASAYFMGHESFFANSYLTAWLRPLLSWGVFIIALIGAMLCLNLLLYRHWVQSERLSFPTTRLPLSLIIGTGQEKPFWHTHAFWIAAVLIGCADLWNQASMFWPAIPKLPIKMIILTPNYTGPFGFFCLSFYPFLIGLAYFMPQDLVFSAVLWYFLKKVFLYFLNINGYQDISEHQFDFEWGVWIGFGALSLWLARGQLRRLFFSPNPGEKHGMPPPPRAALIGFVACLLVLISFCYTNNMGIPIVGLYFALYFLFSLGITKTRAQLGPPFLEFGGGGTNLSLVRIIGPRSFSRRELSIFSMFGFYTYYNRAHLMPNQVEQLYLTERAGVRIPLTTVALMLAALAGLAATYAANLSAAHIYGANRLWFGQLTGAIHFGRLTEWLGGTKFPDLMAAGSAVGGFSSVFVLGAAQNALSWFPIHPVGFVMGMSAECLDYYWLPLTLASVVKTIIIRYGGLRLYGKAMPVFLGLALGEFVVGAGLGTASIIFGHTLYSFSGGPSG